MGRRQNELPGMERKKVAEINKAAEEYVEIRDARMQMTKREVQSKAALLATMKKHEYAVYEDLEADPPLRVEVKAGEDKLRVRQIDGTEAEAPEEKEEREAKADKKGLDA